MSAIAASTSVSGRARVSRLRDVRGVAALVGGAAVLGSLAGMMAASGRPWEVIVLVGVLLPVAVWRQPQLGPVVIFGSALLIEQFPVDLPNGASIGLKQVPITNAIPLFQGMGSLHVDPVDLVLLGVLLVYIARSAHDGTRWWPRSHVSLAMGALAVTVLIGEGLGLSHHGVMRESFLELRPFVYLIAAYVLTAVLIRTRSAVQTMLWTLTVAELVKAIQAVYIFILTRPWRPHPQSILAHEEALFTSLFFFMVIALWLFGLRGRLRTFSTSIVPLVFFAALVNERRTAWLVLFAGSVVLLAVTYVSVPARRRTVRRVAGVLLIVCAGYFPAFWNNQGTLGAPAQAFRSELGSTTTRNAQSDDYRVQEDANLELNIGNAGILGEGLGVPINYAIPMPDSLVKTDPEIMYIPHNGMLYVLMRLGLLGGIAFWGLIGAAIIQGCRLARCLDPPLAMIGALSAALVTGWALEGAVDQGFTLYRAVLVAGCMIGLAEAARRINSQAAKKRQDARFSVQQPGSHPPALYPPPPGLASGSEFSEAEPEVTLHRNGSSSTSSGVS
jgi:hypothetical protein